MDDAKTAQRKMRKMFTPGSTWQRTNYRFPTKQLIGDGSQVKVIPAAQPVKVSVVKPIVDSIVFRLPDGQTSYLSYPDQKIAVARFRHPAGMEIDDTRGPLLSYAPA